MYKKTNNTKRYLELSKKAIECYCLGQRLSSAANLAKELAEMLEESFDYEEAIKFYNKAAEL